MTELLEIARLGHSSLRQQAEPIQNIKDAQLQRLIDSLLITAATHKGVGIAAPQVAKPYRLFIVASHPNERYPHAPMMEPTAMINPKILAWGGEREKGWEGCLSIPNVRGVVPRYEEIEVEYRDRAGNLQRRVLTDFVARIFQHELDHLDGVLFIDRIEDPKDLFSEAEYREAVTSNQ